MKTRFHFSRQRAQLRHLGKQLLQLQQNSQQIPAELLAKFRSLCKKLLPRFGAQGLKQVLGTAALLVGFGAAAQAQSFQPAVVNAFGINTSVLAEAYYNFPAFADLDNDGDLDLMTALSAYDYDTNLYATQFYYFENVGTATTPDFAAPQLNPFNIPVFESDIAPIDLIDVDGDGDLDILATGFNYENGAGGDGATFLIPNEGDAENPIFGDVVVNGLPLPAPGVTDNPLLFAVGDLDGDGDLDILGNAYGDVGGDGLINFYFENIAMDGGITPAPAIINPFGLPSGSGLTDLVVYSDLADLDNDGDLDLLAGQAAYDYGSGVYDFNILFYENTGTATEAAFGEALENPFGIESFGVDVDEFPRPTAVDIDDDGDLDLFTFLGGNLLFQENTLVSATQEQASQLELTLSPNPTSGFVQINSSEQIARIEVSNLMGQQILSLSGVTSNLDLGAQPAGVYLMKVITQDNRFQIFRVQKQ
jgi:hypothetical protein